MSFAESETVKQLLAAVKALRTGQADPPAVPYPPSKDVERAELLDFARNAPLVYGYWRAWKWLYKAAELRNDIEFLGPMAARLDSIPLWGQSAAQSQNFLSNRSLSSIAVQGPVGYVIASGNWNQDAQLFTLNIADPFAPRHLGTVNIKEAKTVQVAGDHAYILAFSRYREQGGLRVVDVSNPVKPYQVSALNMGDATQLCVQNGIVFILEQKNPGNKSGVRVVDVRDPANPQDRGFVTIPHANSIAVSGSHLYVTAQGAGSQRWSLLPTPAGLHVYDISNPTSLKYVHQVKMDHTLSVTVADGYAYVFTGEGYQPLKLHVFDLANPARPNLVGTCDGFARSYSDAWLQVVANGDYLYVMGGGVATTVVHVGDRTKPTIHSRLQQEINTLALYGGEYGLASLRYQNGLTALDISNPAHPSRLGDPPSVDTIGYMKRRARRYLRVWAKKDVELYAELAFRVLSEPIKTRQQLDETLHWVTMDTLYGKSDRYTEMGHGRHGYKLSKPRFVLRKREDRCPEAWNAHPDLALKLFTGSGVSSAVREFALKVLWQTKTPVPALTKEALTNALQSSSLLMQSFAVRQAMERLKAGEKFDPKVLARIYFYASVTRRKQVETLLSTSEAEAKWRTSFAGELLSLATPETAGQTMTRRQSGAISLLARQFPEAVPTQRLRPLLTGLLASGRPELTQLAFSALRGIKPSEAREWIGLLENCPDPWRERGVNAMEEGLRDKAFSYQEASNLIHGYYYFYDYLAYSARSVFYRETGWRLLLAATKTTDSVIEQIGREVLGLKDDAPELLAALQSPAALVLFARIPANMEKLIERVQKEPRLAALLTSDTFAVMARKLDANAMLTFIKAVAEERWAEMREAVLSGLRDGGQMTAFWRAVFEAMPNDADGVLNRRVLQDTVVSDSFLGVEDTEFFKSSDPAFESLLLRWAQVHNDLFEAGSALLITAATHPLPSIRAWGLTRAQGFGITLPFALRLLESEVPASVAVGKAFFEAVTPDSPQAFDYALVLCDSPKETVRKYGQEYIIRRFDALPMPQIITRLTENTHTDMETFVAATLAQNPLPVDTTTFDSQVLRKRNRGRRAKEMVKERVSQAAEPDIATLLEMARSRVPRDAEWAWQQLARLAIDGIPIEGFRIETK